MSILRQLEQRGADPHLPWGSSMIPTNGMMGLPSVAGIALTDDIALSIATVSACVALLADTVSSLPMQVLRRTNDKSKKLIWPQPPVIANPWPEGTVQDWLTQVMVSLTLRGNFYGRIVDRDRKGYPAIIMPVHPDTVTARSNPDTGLREYRINGQLVPLDDIVHIPGPLLLPGQFVALNPVEYQRASWGLAAATARFGGQFFANSANPSGVIVTDQEYNEDEVLEWARSWRQAHGGLGNANMPAILTGGAKWQQITVTPEQAQFLATRTFQREEIISWFRIPPHRMGIGDRTPQPPSYEDLEMLYISDAVLPYVTRIAGFLSQPKMTPPSQVITFDLSSRLRGNTLQRMQAAQISANSGLQTIDEIRSLIDEEPLPPEGGMGRVILRPMNMTAFDVDTGKALNVPDPTLAPANTGGLGDGGGDPNNSPGITKPDKLAAPDLEPAVV